MYTPSSCLNSSLLQQTQKSQLPSNLLSGIHAHIYPFLMGISLISIHSLWKISTLHFPVLQYTPLSYIPIRPFNTQKLMFIITFFAVTHNALVILHISALVDAPGSVSSSVLSKSFFLSFPSTNSHLYIILPYPQHILWYSFSLVFFFLGTNIHLGQVNLLVHI